MRPALVFCLGLHACKKAGLCPGMPSFCWFGDTPESGRPQSFCAWEEEHLGHLFISENGGLSGSHIYSIRSTPQGQSLRLNWRGY